MKNTILWLSFLGLSLITIAQETPETNSLNEGTIQSQYDYIWNSSNNYQTNKVVKMSKLNKFNSNVKDSLNAAYQRIDSLRVTNQAKADQINGITKENTVLNDSLKTVETAADSLNFLGMPTSKSSFKFLFFLVTGVLLAISIFSVFRMRAKSSQASADKANFSMLELELEEFKKKSREKEQVLARQLQDEINKRL